MIDTLSAQDQLTTIGNLKAGILQLFNDQPIIAN
jgi:hypothetical protein